MEAYLTQDLIVSTHEKLSRSHEFTSTSNHYRYDLFISREIKTRRACQGHKINKEDCFTASFELCEKQACYIEQKVHF